MKIFFAINLILCLISCSENKILGKIEFRSDSKNCDNHYQEINLSNSVYIINKSIDKTYEFTVKITEMQNDTSYSYDTEKVKLSPGDESRLGCREYLVGDKFYKKEISDTFYYWNEKTKTIGEISNIKKSEVPDSSKPKAQNHIKKIFECTGQRLIKSDKGS